MKFFKLVFVFIVFTVLYHGPPYKQALAVSCEVLYEVIITLRLPRYGVPSVWDANYGGDGKVIKFSSGLPMEDGTVLAVGEVLSAIDFKPIDTAMIKLNRRGRVLMEKKYKAKLHERSASIAQIGHSYIVASTYSGPKTQRQVRLAWYDKEGHFKRDKTLSDPDYDIEAKSIHRSVEGDGFVIVVNAVHRKDEQDQFGQILRFTDDGQEVWRRSYQPGIANKLAGITIDEQKGHYLATGNTVMEDGRTAGWILDLNNDGTIVWQRSYPRGSLSMLVSGRVLNDKYVFVGESMPIDGGYRAAWVMAVSGLGDVLWQRYYRGHEHAFSGQGILPHADGRVTVSLNAKAAIGSLQKTHIRLITLDPRGSIVQDEPYLYGFESLSSELFFGVDQERIVIANSVTDLSIKSENEGAKTIFEKSRDARLGIIEPDPKMEIDTRSDLAEAVLGNKKLDHIHEGWLLVATPLEPYSDVCHD